MPCRSLALPALFALLAAAMACPAAAETILFEGARIIPGDGSPAIEDGALLVQDSVVWRVGRRGEIAPPEGATRIDATGKTIMPALISTHVHPGFQRGLSYSAQNYTRETVMDDLNRALYFGISTVNSLGVEKGDLLYEIRADQKAGRLGGSLGGAQLLLAGRGIGAPNAGPGAAAYANIAYEITTREQALDAVHELAGKHVDGIKIWVDDRGGRAPSLPIALSRTVIDESHRLGFKVSAHIYYHKDAVELAAAGVDNFAHMVRDEVMSDDLIATMVEKGIYVMPNISFPERSTQTARPDWSDEPWLTGLLADTEPAEVVNRMIATSLRRDEATAAGARAIYAHLRTSVAKLAAADVRIILGSDTGLEDHPFGFAEHRELQLMAEAGMTPGQVIVAATSRAAAFLGLDDRGVIAPDRRADLLVLDANPLDDIRHTRRIAALYIAGKQVDRAAIKAGLMRTAVSAGLSTPPLAQKTVVTLATATPGGGFPLYGDNAAAVINETDPTLDVHTRNTKGSAENIGLLEDGKVDIALVSGEPAYEAFSGIGRPPSGNRIIAAIYSSPGMFAVRGDSPAHAARDLAGKPIAWGTRASGLTLLGRYVMDGLGLDCDKDFQPVYLDHAGDGPAMVADGRAAALWGAGIGWPSFTAVTKAGGRVIGLTPDEVLQVTAKHNFLKPITVPAGAYPGQAEAVNSVGSWAYVLARASLPDDVAYRLAAALDHGHAALASRLDQGRETTPQNTLAAAPRPEQIHPGVMRYLRETGVAR